MALLTVNKRVNDIFSQWTSFCGISDQQRDGKVACHESPLTRERDMDTVITVGELIIAVGAFAVISKALIGRLGDLGLLQRPQGFQQ